METNDVCPCCGCATIPDQQEKQAAKRAWEKEVAKAVAAANVWRLRELEAERGFVGNPWNPRKF